LSIVFAIVLAIALGAAIVWDVRTDARRIISGRNVVLFGIFVWFLIEPLKLPTELLIYTQPEYNFGLLCVALSAVSFLVAYHQSRPRLFDGFGRRLEVIEKPDLQWKLFLVAVAIGIAPMLVYSGFDPSVFLEGVGTFGKRWGGTLARERYGGVRDALLELQMFLKAAVPLAGVILLSRRVGTARRVAVGVFLLWMLLRAVGNATRTEMIQIGLPILAVGYVALNPRRQRLAVLCLPLLAVVGYVWSAAVVISRTSGQFEWSAADRADYAGNEMFRELLYLTTRVPRDMDHLYGVTYYTQLVNPVPRFLWPNKPTTDAGLLLAQAAGEVDSGGEAYLTRSPGLIGEMYWNFGLVGVIGLSALGGFLVRSWDELRETAQTRPFTFIVYIGGLGNLFLFGRSFNLHTLYGLLSLAGLVFLLGRSRSPAEGDQGPDS
jgi:oligosaccharide repeat unit polymerase